MTRDEGVRAAALIQINGGDGMAFLDERDQVRADAMQAVAVVAEELIIERLETLAVKIRNHIAEMLKG